MTVSVLPSDLPDSHTFEAPTEIRSQGQVVDYQFHAESEVADSELLLFDQKVVPGQSGSPVLSADSRGVVGIVVGQWLRPTVVHSGTGAKPLVISPGAALRTHYAIALLRRQGISWHAAEVPVAAERPTPQEGGYSPPGHYPLSPPSARRWRGRTRRPHRHGRSNRGVKRCAWHRTFSGTRTGCRAHLDVLSGADRRPGS